MGENRVQAVLFDFGGVLATEGFQEGLAAIARDQGIDPEALTTLASDAVYETGYVVGTGTEVAFWHALRRRAGVTGTDEELAGAILDRFRLRPRMLRAADGLRAAGITAVILSDQTDWLDRLDARDGFFRRFDRVFNSYHLGLGKRDPAVFDRALAALDVVPGAALFVDDRPGNVERAASRGLRTLLFRDEASALAALERETGVPLRS